MPSITAKGLLSFLRPHDLNAPTSAEQELVREFNIRFPEMMNDMFSYLQDETCGCKDRLIAALNANPEQAEQLVGVIYKNLPPDRPKPTFAITKAPVDDPTVLISIAGDVMEIPQDTAEYRKLLRQLYAERKVYQGLFIMPTANTWRLFFY